MVSTSARIRSRRRSARPTSSHELTTSSSHTRGTPTSRDARRFAVASRTDSRLVPTYTRTRPPPAAGPVEVHSRYSSVSSSSGPTTSSTCSPPVAGSSVSGPAPSTFGDAATTWPSSSTTCATESSVTLTRTEAGRPTRRAPSRSATRDRARSSAEPVSRWRSTTSRVTAPPTSRTAVTTATSRVVRVRRLIGQPPAGSSR